MRNNVKISQENSGTISYPADYYIVGFCRMVTSVCNRQA